MKIVKVTPHCGAEILGVALDKPLDHGTVDALGRALAEHCVLFFRDQQLTPEQHKALGRAFGALHLHPAYPDILEGHPEIMVIRADENSKRIAGEDWHSDVSCDPEPPLGSILYMQEVPASGGDTLFASMYAAYDALSAPMRRFLAGLTALHDGESTYRGRYEGMKNPDKPYPSSEHPVVRTHPVTGRPALFVNRIFTRRIVQLSARESDALLEMLFRHIETPEFQCRFRWAPGSVAFWDNRCAQHHALWDYYPERRRGLRVTIQGERPFYRA
jgi:alpha-ketoglutarate-dependent taurine dioxygenase